MCFIFKLYKFAIMLIYNFLFFIFDLLRIQRSSFAQFIRTGLAQEINNNQTVFWTSKSKKIILYGQYYRLLYPKLSIRDSILSAKTYMTEIFIPVLYSQLIVNSWSEELNSSVNFR